MVFDKSEKIEVLCPDCLTKNEVLYFPSNKHKVQVMGTRAGTSTQWTGRGEKVEGICKKCKYKFKVADL